MQTLLNKLQAILPDISFEAGEAFFWSPKTKTITYSDTSGGEPATHALLHECAHALLGHKVYSQDMELLLLEVAAWEKAKSLGASLGITINEDHIQDCLDTYRDWLHQRSTCPRCSTVSLQTSPQRYQCHNCSASWQVSISRFCRPYRLSGTQSKKSPELLQTTFR